MTGREIVEWIEENGAENAEIYVEVRPKLFRPSMEFEVLGGEDCYELIVLK